MTTNQPTDSKAADSLRGSSEGTFLGAVAQAYADRYDRFDDCCFLFPNKRSSAFFLKSLAEAVGDRATLAPEVLDIAEFTSRIAGLEQASRIDLLFRLYRVYTSLRNRTTDLSADEDVIDFDRFAPWGEIVLSDFSEVDQYDVDAEALFWNVRDYRQIESNFLSEEQRAMVERYFGYSPQLADVEDFWKSVGPDDERTELRDKFVALWRRLPELYSALRDDLLGDDLALPGTVFRRAMQIVTEHGCDALPWRKVVVVGFNMLSTTELKIFETMRDSQNTEGEPFADFVWDAPGPVLSAPNSVAAHSIARNIRMFPAPDWVRPYLSDCQPTDMPPVIEVAAAPSNTAQTKIAAMRVDDWIEKSGTNPDTRSAIVVPDENLLLPLLHSLPESLKTVNLTMGYSMRFTSIASFMFHFRKLQTHRRIWNDRIAYQADDLRDFLAHPLVQLVIGSDASSTVNSWLDRHHKRLATVDDLRSLVPDAMPMLEPVDDSSPAGVIIAALDSRLELIDRALVSTADQISALNPKIERSQIATYRLALGRLDECVARYSIALRFNTLLHLVDRLIAGEKVTFEGKPLEGMQIMGVLETRALDFERLIVLSMNDKVMPRRSKRRTFIPDTLRTGYGLPPSWQNEELYAYYFYRLIARADEVLLIYDARAGEGMRSGGKSRFLLQLDMLYARNRIRETPYAFRLNSHTSHPVDIAKTDAVMTKLRQYLDPDSGVNLSASALMNYCSCQLLFYFKNVLGIKEETVLSDAIDNITQGNIVHRAMLCLYFPKELRRQYLSRQIVYDRDAIVRIADNRSAIEREVRRAVNYEHFHLDTDRLDTPLPETIALVADRLADQVEKIVRHDLEHAPLILAGGEVSGTERWSIGSSPTVNIRYAIDRIDLTDGQFRIIDYKTGNAKIESDWELNNVLQGKKGTKYLLQLLLYADLLSQRVRREQKRDSGPVGMGLINVNNPAHEILVRPLVSNPYGKKGPKLTVTDHTQLYEPFAHAMESLLSDLFNPDIPFKAPENLKEACKLCSLHSLCGSPQK